MQYYSVSQGKIVDDSQTPYTPYTGSSTTTPSGTNTNNTGSTQIKQPSIKNTPTSPTPSTLPSTNTSGASGSDPQQALFEQYYAAAKTSAQKDAIYKQWTDYNALIAGPKAQQKQVSNLQKGPKTVNEPGPFQGWPIIGNIGKKTVYQYPSSSGGVATATTRDEAVNAINDQLAALGQNSIPNTPPNQPATDQLAATQKDWTSSTGEKMNMNPAGLPENIINNIISIAKGVPGMVGELAQLTSSDPRVTASVLATLGKGMLQNLAQTTGVNKNTIGMDSQGHFYWNPGQQLKDAMIHDYNHPIDTLLWVLPVLKGMKGSSGVMGSAADAAPTVEKAVYASADNAAGKAATGIVPTGMEDVVKASEMYGKALQITPGANSIWDIAKALKQVIPDQAKIISDWVSSQDAKIGPQDYGEIKNQILSEVQKTSAAQANPNLVTKLGDILDGQLKTGSNGLSTNFGKMDATRMYLNPSDSWFESGQPVGTPTNDLNAIKYAGSKAIKNIMGEADPTGVVKGALDKQHVAFETGPSFSKAALNTVSPKIGGIGWRFQLIRKVWNSLAGPSAESLKIQNARGLQGDYSIPGNPPDTIPQPDITTPQEKIAIQNNINSRAENSSVPKTPPQNPATPISSVPETPPTTPTVKGYSSQGSTLQLRPTMEQVQLDSVLKQVPVAQKSRLLKEIAANDWTPRQATTKILQMIKKGKYQ